MESYQLLKSEGEILVQGLRSLQLPLFTWGNQNNFEENRRRQAVLGVNGVIYDRFVVIISHMWSRVGVCLEKIFLRISPYVYKCQ